MNSSFAIVDTGLHKVGSEQALSDVFPVTQSATLFIGLLTTDGKIITPDVCCLFFPKTGSPI